MTRPAQDQTRISFPPPSLVPLAQLLSVLDEFLRSSNLIADNLTDYLHHCGSHDPGYDACILIDELSFTALTYRQLAADIDRTAKP